MFWRIFGWLRRRQRLADLLWVSPLLALSWLQRDQGAAALDRLPGDDTVHLIAYLALTAALCGPLVWRRRWPVLVFGVVAAVAFVQWLAGVILVPPDLAVLPALYTVAAYCSRRWAVLAVVVAELGGLLALVREEGTDWPKLRGPWLFSAIFIGGVWIFGIYVSTRRAYTRSLEERAARLERERDNHALIAAASERARIARELHDVVAHNVSVMVVQADGAAYTLDSDPERAKHAMEAISLTGRQALTEMRRLLGVLRDGAAAGPYAPQPGVEQLTELVEHTRASGLPVELTIDGRPTKLDTGVQLAVYRVVQEALTNTMKHAGPAAMAQVSVEYGDETIKVRVNDDGRGAAAVDDGLGHGLLGMRERVALYGGTVTTGPRAGGGYTVVASLPTREGARA